MYRLSQFGGSSLDALFRQIPRPCCWGGGGHYYSESVIIDLGCLPWAQGGGKVDFVPLLPFLNPMRRGEAFLMLMLITFFLNKTMRTDDLTMGQTI